jgi:hypothetical protein
MDISGGLPGPLVYEPKSRPNNVVVISLSAHGGSPDQLPPSSSLSVTIIGVRIR